MTNSGPGTVDVSICMVSLNCWDVLRDCLDSLRASNRKYSHEIIMVDNASTDDTVAKTIASYPEVRIIRNRANVGFTIATNQAIRASSGKYILWLNTDTILERDTISKLVEFLEREQRAGIVGPKVLNADGSFQPQCRRGMPTPGASLAYLVGADRLFPRSRIFGEYLKRYLPVDEANRVTAVSGCCLLARREVWNDIGPLDEEVFGFGEDIDWCVRATKAGWDVWYYPESQIVHLKGKGGAHARPYARIRGLHQCMWTFYRKHLASQYSLPVTLVVRGAIAISLYTSLMRVWIARRFS